MEPIAGSSADVLEEVERTVLGCDYGGSSWTDREEAARLGARLALGPGVRALEVGAGSGWPGLHLASLLGCEMTLLDTPVAGLRRAARRAAADRIAGRCRPVAGEGARLPFAASSFDAVLHCDVLC